MELPSREPSGEKPTNATPEDSFDESFMVACMLAEALAREQDPVVSCSYCYCDEERTEATLELFSKADFDDSGDPEVIISVDLTRDTEDESTYFSLSFDGNHKLIDPEVGDTENIAASAVIARDLLESDILDDQARAIVEHLAKVIAGLQEDGQPESFGRVAAGPLIEKPCHITELVEAVIYLKGDGQSLHSRLTSHDIEDGSRIDIVYNRTQANGILDNELEKLVVYDGEMCDPDDNEEEDDFSDQVIQEIPRLKINRVTPNGEVDLVCKVEFDGEINVYLPTYKANNEAKYIKAQKAALETLIGQLIEIGSSQRYVDSNSRYVSDLGSK